MKDPLIRRLNLFAFLDEFGPVYAIYPLWLAAGGMSTAEISVLYVVWAAVGIVLEVPSGALADRVDRRHLVAFALILRALGIGVMFHWPNPTGFFAGAVLWATHTALASGAYEAMIYDQLAARGMEERYAVVQARMDQWSHLGVAAGTGLSWAFLNSGWGMSWSAYATIALHLPSFALLLSLPRLAVAGEGDATFASWWKTLKAGVNYSLKTPDVLRLVLLGCVLEGLFILDEYVHLLGKARGLPDERIPILVAMVWGGLLVGGELAARVPQLSRQRLGLLLAAGGLSALVALTQGAYLGAFALALAYLVLNTSWILVDARTQQRLQDETRATVTSVRSFLASFNEMAALGAVGWLASGNDPTPGLTLLLCILVASGILVGRWAVARMETSPSGLGDSGS